MIEESNISEEVKNRFFDAVKSENMPEILKYFRDEKYRVWLFREEDEYTALHRATFMNLTLLVLTMIDEMKLRLGIEAKREIKKWINEKSEQGHTALHYASYRGNIEIIDKLIDNGADVEIANNRGLNVLHMAAQGNQPGALVYFKEKFLLNIQSVDDLGSTPLHWACYTGSEISVLFLLSWNPDVNAQDREGLTPLHLAVMSERTRIIKKLLQKGADRKIKDNKGRTPYDLAISKSKLTIVEMLKERADCQLCILKAPLHKRSKNSFNIVFFFILHFIIETSVFFILLPFFNSQTVTITYIALLIIVIVLFIIMMYSDSGFIKRDESKPLIRLVEEKVNIADFCPLCQIQKTATSKHCVICDKCVEGFDHHCYWVNNCVGKANLYMFLFFIVIIFSNILYNIVLSVLCLVYKTEKDIASTTSTFPPALPWKNLYLESVKTVISSVVLLVGVIFLFPVIIILFVQIKNWAHRIKKNSFKKRSVIMRNSKLSNNSKSDKSTYLLQNLRTDDENVLIVEKRSKKT